MLKEVVNRLRGQVRIRVECAFPERVLNLCSARNLAFWDLAWESPTEFTCRLSRQDLRALRRSAEKLSCTIEVLRREGAPYFFSRFRRRTALWVGLVICGLGLLLGSFFIWEFEIEGNTTVPDTAILRALERCGVRRGTFGLSLDGEDLRNHVLLELPQLCWLSVNVSGCRAHVQVRERIDAPPLLNEATPSNIVARRSGLILRVEALDGVQCVLPGTAVTEGQLLISGVEDMETFGARTAAGRGTVTARTWYALTTSVPLSGTERQYTGKETTRGAVVIGTRRIKFFANSSIEDTKYDKITKRHACALFGVPLPVTWVTETLRFYEPVSVKRDAVAAEQAAEEALTGYLHALVEPYGEVKSTLCTSRQKGDVLEVTLTAECVESIGRSVPILTEEAENDP